MRTLIAILISLTLVSCRDIEPHGVYHASDFNGYEHLILDFYGTETIRVFGIKDGKLELSKGAWKPALNDKFTMSANTREIDKGLLESANYYLKPFINRDFQNYAKTDLSLELEILSFNKLQEIESEKIFETYEIE